MKKFYAPVLLIIVLAAFSTVLFAGSAEQNTNHSAEYMKTLNRGASTDADATFYNPAGTAFMKDGAYIYLSAQTIYIPIEIDSPGLTRTVYRGQKTSYVMPDLHFVYNKEKVGGGEGNLAWSIGLMPIGGGGFGRYDKGLPYIDDMLFLLRGTLGTLLSPFPVGPVMTSKFEGTSAYFSGMTNVAYSFLGNRMAVSLGYRFIYGWATYDAKFYSNGIVIPLMGKFHAQQDGTAHGVIVGISAQPVDAVTIGFKFEYNSPLNLKTKSTGDALVGMIDSSLRNGGVAHRQLPMNANLGIAYRIQGFQLSWTFSYYFNRLAQWNGKERNFVDGFEAGMGLDYTFTAVPINIGCGYVYTSGGARPSGQSQMAELNNGNTFGAGISYTFDKKIRLTVAFGYIYFLPVHINEGTQLKFVPGILRKNGFNAAIGAEFKVI
jgi:long-chain fatty acid transport protein